jgi:hypothetical protein
MNFFDLKNICNKFIEEGLGDLEIADTLSVLTSKAPPSTVSMFDLDEDEIELVNEIRRNCGAPLP